MRIAKAAFDTAENENPAGILKATGVSTERPVQSAVYPAHSACTESFAASFLAVRCAAPPTGPAALPSRCVAAR